MLPRRVVDYTGTCHVVLQSTRDCTLKRDLEPVVSAVLIRESYNTVRLPDLLTKRCRYSTTKTWHVHAAPGIVRACVSADLDPSRFWIPYDVTHCLSMRSSLKCRKVTYKMCVAHPVPAEMDPLFASWYSFG